MTTLITGADGYLGRRIAAALPDEELILAVRSGDFSGNRIRVDLREPDAFATVDPSRITRIIHAAAVTRFDVDLTTAWEVNVAGTARVREFAERCEQLERLVHLSTLYTAGRREGDVYETRHEDVGFVNHYEWSKWAAEECMLDHPGLPVTVLRLPTVIAEDDDGRIGQYNAFHHTLRLYSSGLLTLLPGNPATPLSLATAEFTVDAVIRLLDAEPGIYQVCSGQIPLHTTLDTAFTAFDRDPAFQRRMLPRPILCDRDSFADMMTAAKGLRGGDLHAALGWVGPFAEQLYLPKVFHTQRLHAACPGLRATDPLSVIESVCTNLIAGRTHAASH